MSLISLHQARFDYGREIILNKVDLAIQPGTRYALVGPNGAGKTTLLAALAGELELSPQMRQARGSARIVLLKQETVLASSGAAEPLLTVVSTQAFAREREIEAELAQVTGQLEVADHDHQQELARLQGHLQAEFERLDGYKVQTRLESALAGVGLPEETWSRPPAQLSGGERRRGALAAVLLSGADLLLLDEPTNHLDLDAREWLEKFLGQYPGAAIVVSHDRHFLDKVVHKTLHLDGGKLVGYSGNYSFFAEQNLLRYEQDLAAWQRQQTKIKQTEEYIRRNIEGQNTKQAKSRRKQLAKEEILIRPTADPSLYRFRLEPRRTSGGTVLQANGLSKGWGGRVLLREFDLHVTRGDRIGIIGPNGCGKTTLLKLLAGRLNPDQGSVVQGHNVDLGYHDQELTSVSDQNTALAEMAEIDPRATIGDLRTFLGAFGFGEDLFDRQVGRLSGGERSRLALMRLIKEGHNTLLLDEPTNHLDVRSRESLESALIGFAGTLVMVSHDRRLLDRIADKMIIFTETPGQVVVFDGNYSDHVRHRDKNTQAREPNPGPQAKTPGTKISREELAGRRPLSKNEQERRRQRIAETETRIDLLEAEKIELLAVMNDPALDNQERIAQAGRCGEIDQELSECLDRWEQWSREIEEGIDR